MFFYSGKVCHVYPLYGFLEPLLILALGKGIEKIELTEIGSDGDRAYYRKNGTHYVPKVRLEDLLIG